MSKLLQITGPNHEAMIKEALMGAAMTGIGSLMGRAGSAVVRNPLKSLGYAFTASDAMSGATKMRNAAAAGREVAANTPRITM